MYTSSARRNIFPEDMHSSVEFFTWSFQYDERKTAGILQHKVSEPQVNTRPKMCRWLDCSITRANINTVEKVTSDTTVWGNLTDYFTWPGKKRYTTGLPQYTRWKAVHYIALACLRYSSIPYNPIFCLLTLEPGSSVAYKKFIWVCDHSTESASKKHTQDER